MVWRRKDCAEDLTETKKIIEDRIAHAITVGNTLIFLLFFFSGDTGLLQFVAAAENAERQKQELCGVLEKDMGNRFIVDTMEKQ